ncbi:MAG TPA: VOC family protein [Solirubrobacterales bacterium]
MLQHVGIEILPADVDRAALLFELLGFEPVEPPPTLADGYTWLERNGTQVHLMHEADPVVPPRAHVAVHVPDFDAAHARLRDHGFDPVPGREHWGTPRSLVTLPGGQRIELMATPPPAADRANTHRAGPG